MSFPASGLESVYRNKIKNVAKFLDTKHAGRYRIYNLSNRSYDYKKFKGVVRSYHWVDHHSPSIQTLFEVCEDMFNYLVKDPNRVIVVHCNAGKGRTGTSIACFLMYWGLLQTAEDAIKYYGRKRFSSGLGVTGPSQLRYIKYFEEIFQNQIKSPSAKRLKSVSAF